MRGAARRRAQAKKAAKNSNKGSAGAPKQSSSSHQVPGLDPFPRHRALKGWNDFSESSSPPAHNGFSMTQAARNTERHGAAWGATKFRDQAIAFVSAGNLVQEDIAQASGKDKVEEAADYKNQEVEPAIKPTDASAEHDVPASLPPEPAAPTQLNQEKVHAEPQVANIASDTPIPPTLQQASRTEQDSIDSSDSGEEIIFHGRVKKQPVISSKQVAPTESPKPEAVATTKPSLPAAPATAQSSSNPKASAVQPAHQPKAPIHRRGVLRGQVSDEEEAILQDYIANMAMDDDDDDDDDNDDSEMPASTVTGSTSKRNQHFRLHNGGGEENAKVQLVSQKAPRQKPVVYDEAPDWDSADLEDFDDLDTTDDEVGEISQVLRHRTRPTGSQYLVTAVGKGASEAKWVPRERLVSATAKEEIRIFEDIQAIKAMETSEDLLGGDSDDDDEDEDDDDDDEDEALDDLLDDIESEDDENERILKHTSRMTDEELSRMLAKQEELGLGGDELEIFDGRTGHGGNGLDSDDFVPYSVKKHLSNRTKAKRGRRQRDSFPSAGAFADALDQDPYGAFDVMDFDRPSLKPKKKGRKSGLPDFDLEDDDLREQLQSTWQRDREKKALRKREKLEARESALLEASERNDPATIKAEIRQFLVQEVDELELAPMDATMRASVHRLAKALGLGSRSKGKDGVGAGRYPVLSKTPRTGFYTIDTVWQVDALMDQRKFFPKAFFRGTKSPRTPGAARARRGGGGAMSGATYMNGDIVGASAPEIGSDNKGRAMLEKMGWTSGMGIGAVGNKGGVDVIKHVVKTTKAGLG